MRSRLVGLFWGCFLLLGLLILRLAVVQYFEHDRYAALAREQQEGHIVIPALRGEIRDRNGVVLATSRALHSVALNPLEVERPGATARALARALDTDPSAVTRLLRGGGHFAWVARKVPDEVAARVRRLDLPGVFLLKEPTGRRFYPKGRLAAHVLGATGIDDQGLDGVEARFDEVLAGQPGLVRAFLDRDGWALPGSARLVRRAVPGRHLVLTLDETLQYVAEQQLARAVKEHRARGGICLVMDARTAEVLAMAVYPGFSPERFPEVDPEVRRNRAITDPYEPGSTFKVFLAAAALEAGVDPQDRFRAGGTLTIGGWPVHNANDGLYAGAEETLTDIIVYSFNVGTASVALHIGRERFARTLRAFGFGSPTGILLAGEDPGILPDVEDWKPINTATISFGQGVAVTPIQLVSAAQAVANGGVRLRPRLVKAVLEPDGTVARRFDPEVLGRAIRPETARALTEILYQVCERGTGRRARVPGYRVAGKTGTAQVVDRGVYAPGRYIASFLGFAPVEDPRVVVLVKIEEPAGPYWGGVVAAPVFRRVVGEALWRMGVRPTEPVVQEVDNG